MSVLHKFTGSKNNYNLEDVSIKEYDQEQKFKSMKIYLRLDQMVLFLFLEMTYISLHH